MDPRRHPGSAVTGGVLATIIEHKRAEVVARRNALPLAAIREQAEGAPPVRGFHAALMRRRPAVIAELKKASPSAGVIRRDFHPAAIAESYARAGAACLSVLTDERFFQGADSHLEAARSACALPVLRKDFVVDAYQIYESRALGADCVLLMASVLERGRLADFASLAAALGLDMLFEVHDRAELDTVLSLQPALVGINNRDLHTFETRLATTTQLREHIPADLTVVAESGIHMRADVRRLRAANVHAFLVGTAFMRQADPGRGLTTLFGSMPQEL